MDPTAVDIWTFTESTGLPTYAEFVDGNSTKSQTATELSQNQLTTLGFSDSGLLKITENSVLDVQNNADFSEDAGTISLIESSWNTSEFINIDDADKTNLFVLKSASRGTVGTVDYGDNPTSLMVGYQTASLTFDTEAVGVEWNSGEELPLLYTDNDLSLIHI